MSRGPGRIETRIRDLFLATCNRALSVDEIVDHAYSLAGKPASLAQRLSSLRAAHRAIRRPTQDPSTIEWSSTTIGKGRATKLWFHPADWPVQVWAVGMVKGGVRWFDAEIIRVTELNVMVRYGGGVARLNRSNLSLAWAWWRGVRFVSSRTGYIAAKLEEIWWQRYGTAGVPPVMHMPLADAIASLGVPQNYTRENVIATFRWAVKAHPDLGGTAEVFRRLVEARDRLLAALGTSASPVVRWGTPVARR